MSTVDTAQATDLQGAANAFEGILAREDNEKPETVQTADAPEGANEPEPETPETPAEDEPEAEGGEGDGSANDPEPEEQPTSPALVAVTVDGKTEHLPIEEVAKGYQRQADYTRKTMAHAEQVRAFEAERQQTAQYRAQYEQILPALVAQLQQPEPDWNAIRQVHGNEEYLLQRENWRDRQERIAAAQYEMHVTQNLKAQEQAAEKLKAREEGLRRLPELIPEYKNAARYEADRPRLIEHGKNVGFTVEELNNALDPRAILLLKESMEYRKLMANKPRPTAPNGPRVLPAGSSNTTPKNASAVSKAKARLAQTGSTHDAAAAFLAMEPLDGNRN